MSYRKTWTKTFSSDEFKDPEVPWGEKSPVRCPDHPGRCLKADNNWFETKTSGTWKLRVPIDVKTEMAGEKQKVLSLNTKGLWVQGFGTIWWLYGSDISLIADEAIIFKYSGLSHSENQWATNPLTVNKMIDAVTSLGLALYQVVDVQSGYLAWHDADITISCEYYVETPPSKGDVEVTVIDAETIRPLNNILVRLMSGTVAVRSGYTDASGMVTWTNVDEGSYMLSVRGYPATLWSKGYESLEMAVSVVADVTNAFTAELPSIPPPPIPWYVWAGVGVAGVGIGLAMLKPRMPTLPITIQLPKREE